MRKPRKVYLINLWRIAAIRKDIEYLIPEDRRYRDWRGKLREEVTFRAYSDVQALSGFCKARLGAEWAYEVLRPYLRKVVRPKIPEVSAQSDLFSKEELEKLKVELK